MFRPSRTGFAFFALLAVLLTSQFGLALLAQLLWPAITTHSLYVWILSFLPLYGIALPFCLLVLRKEEVLARMPDDTSKMTVGGWLLALLMTFGLMFIGSMIGTMLTTWIGILRGKPLVNNISELILNGNLWIIFICTVIIAPLGEEFIFRRLLIDRTRKWGDRTAILLSSLMFGAFHLNLHQFFYAFLIGLVLGYVYLRTGKLRYAVSLHAAINLCGGVFIPWLIRRLQPMLDLYSTGIPETSAVLETMLSHLPEIALLFGYYALMIGSAIAALILALVCRKRLRFSATVEQPRAVFLDLGLLLFFVLCAAMMVFSIVSQ